MKTIFWLRLLALIMVVNYSRIYGQNSNDSSRVFGHPGLEFSMGSAPLDEFVDPVSNEDYWFYENSVHGAFLIDITKHINIGLQYNYLWTRFQQETQSEHYIVGILGRYEHLFGKKLRLFGESSFDYGNYCPCIKDEGVDNYPYKKEDITYLGLGIGSSYQVIRSFRIYLSMAYYTLLEKQPPQHFEYFQPLFGIQYYIN